MGNVKIQLKPADEHHIFAAKGWFDLGNWQKASKQLDQIPPKKQAQPVVLTMRCGIYLKAEKWDDAAKVAKALTKSLPGNSYGWINLAYSTRRKKTGSLVQAKKILLKAEPNLPKDYRFPLNLACYCSQLGELKDAKRWLRKAMAIDKKIVKEKAIEDDDLKPLRDSMAGDFGRAGDDLLMTFDMRFSAW